MQPEHLLIKLHSRRRACHRRVEVADISSGRLNVARGAIGIQNTMARDYRCRMQGLDLIQREQPLFPGLCSALREIRVCVVIDGIAGYDQTDGRYRQRRGVRGVGMPEFDDRKRGSQKDRIALARGNASSTTLRHKKWSPSACVT
jgi:hypothetical protein